MKHLTGVLTATLAVLAATMSMANWRHDTGASLGVFYAGAYSEPAAVGLRCVGQMPGQTLGATDTSFSPPFGFLVEFGPNLVPPPGTTDRRNDLAIWVGNKGFQLPQMIWNDLDGVWVAPVLMTDQLVTAMRQGGRLVAGPVAGGQYEIPAGNMGVAIEQAMTHCIPLFAAQGHNVPAPLSDFLGEGTAVPSDFLPGQANAQAGMREAARADALRLENCNAANVIIRDRAVSLGDIDGDGQADAVLDWRGVECSTGGLQRHCGASHCQISVYLSSIYPRTRKADQLIGIGGGTIALSNGLSGVEVGGGLGDCSRAGRGNNGCTFVWYWDGIKLELIP